MRVCNTNLRKASGTRKGLSKNRNDQVVLERPILLKRNNGCFHNETAVVLVIRLLDSVKKQLFLLHLTVLVGEAENIETATQCFGW
jgi:hypothetical protein